jgi:hypothetical protein
MMRDLNCDYSKSGNVSSETKIFLCLFSDLKNKKIRHLQQNIPVFIFTFISFISFN